MQLPDDAEDFFSPQKKLDKGKGKAKEDPDAQSEDTTIPPSTKMRHLLELVQGYLAEDPRAKILVFSQFVEFLDLLRAFLKLNNIESIGYRGSMSQPQRDEAIRRFNTSAEFATPIPIMLISTKAGGVGLNLTMASKVIMCELAVSESFDQADISGTRRRRTKQSTGPIVSAKHIKSTSSVWSLPIPLKTVSWRSKSARACSPTEQWARVMLAAWDA